MPLQHLSALYNSTNTTFDRICIVAGSPSCTTCSRGPGPPSCTPCPWAGPSCRTTCSLGAGGLGRHAPGRCVGARQQGGCQVGPAGPLPLDQRPCHCLVQGAQGIGLWQGCTCSCSFRHSLVNLASPSALAAALPCLQSQTGLG